MVGESFSASARIAAASERSPRALIIVEPEPPVAQLRLQDAILFAQVRKYWVIARVCSELPSFNNNQD